MKIKGIISVLMLLTVVTVQAQRNRDLGPPTLGVASGTLDFQTSEITLQLLKSSQTVASLKAASNPDLDYTPGDRLEQRNKNNFYHLGDINLGYRKEGNTEWTHVSTAAKRKPVLNLDTKANELVAADLSPTLPDQLPLKVIRTWRKSGENIVLEFQLTNTSDYSVEIGALGIPMVFNNNFNSKSLDEAHAENTFFDPYIGKDAGYLQVVQLNGKSKVLLVVPEDNTPFENYRPLPEDPTPIGYTFEGLHEWMVHSKAYAETEWEGVEQWNSPTSAVVKPGESKTYGLKFILAPSLREIENTLIAAERPVAVGIPGYVVPIDVNAKLFLKYPEKIASWQVEPAGAMLLSANETTEKGWLNFDVKAQKWGRVRLTINYQDGVSQTINYKIIEPEAEVIASYGHFLTTEQWFNNESDPFNRAPSVITYDYEKKEQVTQDSRAWIPGLSDEGGAGSWLGAIMKQVVQPEAEEVEKLEAFVQETLWGGIQYNEGDRKYGVRKSMFYYEPDSMPAGTYSDEIRWGQYDGFPSWSKRASESVVRSYNYPHVAAAHWAMYRLARYHKGYVSEQNWKWYLENAFYTSIAMVEQAPHYAQFGQMEGTIFLLILEDLKAEGMDELAHKLEVTMKARVNHWAELSYPFGSEMPWDSTGQEEVYMWSKYFGLDNKAMVTLNAILAYMPTVPHWGYNGNARRIWDFLYGGKLSRFERMIHHYGSALNAIPVLHNYRENPNDLYLLRVGYGGLMGAISNITQDGFAPCAFHSFPQTLKNDGITGDYGTGFFGYAINSSSYLFNHDDFGWLAFGGNINKKGKWISLDLTTAARNKVFLAPVELWINAYAGKIKSIAYHQKSKTVKVTFDRGDDYTAKAFIAIDGEEYSVNGRTKNKTGLYEIDLNSTTELVLKHK